MRSLVKIFVVVMLSAGLTSCEKIKSIFDVEFDTTLNGDLDINVDDPVKKSTNAFSFSSSTTISPTDDDDINEYVNNIKSFEVNDVIAEVLYVNKGEVVFKSGTSFYISDSQAEVRWTLSSDWAIMEGTQLTLEDAGELYKAVAEILDKKSAFTIGAEGESSETGVEITLRIGIDTKVTASPL